ncbi:MAG: alpha/beta hydrolase [Bacteroidota bacterium]
MRSDQAYQKLQDGRRLGFCQYGDLAGFSVFGLHGLPGSRKWFTDDNETAQSLGIRLITVDRPGFGISDPKSNRSFLDFGDDIHELAGSFGIEKYSVFGISGGGPYAAACAFQHPGAIHRRGLISTVNRFENGNPPSEMAAENRSVFTLSKRFPWLLKLMLKQQKKIIEAQPERYVRAIMRNTNHLCASDRLIMEQRDTAEFMLTHMGEAFRGGVEGTVFEARLFTRDWGFDIKDIEVPIELWHGREDTLSPFGPVQRLGDDIQEGNRHFIEGKGHFLTEEEGIWESILRSMK